MCNDPECKFCQLCICGDSAGSHVCGDGECCAIGCMTCTKFTLDVDAEKKRTGE